MANRELVVLGTASQAPTRMRNHNGYLLRWEDEGLLFDPGEGTQRQMLLAGVRASEISRICITHFHGDHCLGLPGVLQRLSLDRVAHEVACYYPAEGEEYFWRLRHAAIFHDLATIREYPVGGDPAGEHPAGEHPAGEHPAGEHLAGEHLAGELPAGEDPAGEDPAGGDPAGEHPVSEDGWVIGETAAFRLTAWRLSHRVPTIGYQLAEPDGHRMVPERLAAVGISGPDVGRLAQQGWLDVNGRRVHLAEVSEPRPGQRFAFIMDTRLCEAVFALAEGADLMVCESTFLASDAALAPEYGHLTAIEAGQIAAQSGVRTLVLAHFSQRYAHEDPRRFADEAASVFGGEIVVAADLERIPVPRRR